MVSDSRLDQQLPPVEKSSTLDTTTIRRLQFSQHQAGIEPSCSVSEIDPVTPESEREHLPVSVSSDISSDSEARVELKQHVYGHYLGQDTRKQVLPDQAQNSSAVGSETKVATPLQRRKEQYSPQVKRVSTDHTSHKRSSPSTEKRAQTASKIPILCSKARKGPTSTTTTSHATQQNSSEYTFYQTQKSAPAGKESERVKVKPKRSKSEAKGVVKEVSELRLDLSDLMISNTDNVLTIIRQLHKEYSHFSLKITCGDKIIWGRKLYIRTESNKKKLYQQLKLIIDGIRDDYPDLIEQEVDVVIYGVYYHQQ